MKYTQEQIDGLASFLFEHGYTDGVDVSPEISLGEYGILRNPTTGLVAYAMGDEDSGYVLDWTRADLDDVR